MFLFVLIYFIWFQNKNTLIERKDLKENQIKSNRFQRNYKVFKNLLITKQKYILPENNLVLGNKNSNLKLALITSPFCRYCKVLHEILSKLTNEDISLEIIFSLDFEKQNEETLFIYRNLVAIFLEKGEVAYNNAMKNWFNNSNFKEWKQTFEINFKKDKIDSILKNHNEWCNHNNQHFTPVILINGYEYPEIYNRENLKYFINELLEDKDF